MEKLNGNVPRASAGVKMDNYRKNAIITGVLFIIATVTNMLGNLSIQPLLVATDYLVQISANENLILIALLLVLISAFASASIAIWLYPTLKKHNEALALGSVGLSARANMGWPVGSDCFYYRVSTILYHILSIKTRSSVAIRLGYSGSCIIACISRVSDSWPVKSFVDGFHCI